MHGVAYLQEQIAQKVENLYAVSADVNSEITITSGATEALFVAIHPLVGNGDEIIVFDPAFDSYDPAIKLAGGRAIHNPLSSSSFSIDWERVSEAITPRTRAIIINSPHNPTGSVMDAEFLRWPVVPTQAATANAAATGSAVIVRIVIGVVAHPWPEPIRHLRMDMHLQVGPPSPV